MTDELYLLEGLKGEVVSTKGEEIKLYCLKSVQSYMDKLLINAEK